MHRNPLISDSTSISPEDNGEISLIDILCFLKGTYKTMLIFAILGIGIAITYLVVAPKRYVSTAQITMAQIAATNSNANSLGVSIEEPALVILRLNSPISYTPEVLEVCGLQDQKNADLDLSKSIELRVTQGVPNVIGLKAFGSSPQASKNCAQAVFELIKTTQSQIITPYIEEAKLKLADDEDRLAKAKDLVAKSDRSSAVMGVAYLLTRDEIRYLLDEIADLKNVVASNQNRATRLVAPIYSGNIPVAPKKQLILVFGLFGGLFLGFLIALIRVMTAKIKSEAGGTL